MSVSLFIFLQVVNEISFLFRDHPVLYIPSRRPLEASEILNVATPESVTALLVDILNNSGNWRTKSKVIWDVKPELLHAMNAERSEQPQQCASLKASSRLECSLTSEWISISAVYPNAWKEKFEEFLIHKLLVRSFVG